MISALALAIFAQATVSDLPVPAGPPTEEVAGQIAQIEARMERWKGGVYKKDGKLTCRTTQPSGDEEVDVIRCGAMLRCLAPEADALDAIAQSEAPEADRNRRMQAIVAAAQPCVTDANAAGVRMLAERRAQA